MAVAERRILIGTYRQPVLGLDGQPVLQTPADWRGPVVERLAIPTVGECGPQFTGMPVICTSKSVPGRRWYKCCTALNEVPVPPNGIDILSATYEREYERWECEPGHETLCLRLHPAMLERYLQDDGFNFDLETRYAHKDEMLTRLLFELADEMQCGMPNGTLFAEGLSLAIFGWLRQHYSFKAQAPSGRKSGFSIEQRDRLRDFIETHLGTSLSLDAMAAEVGMSAFHFLRVFRTSFGTTPHRYVLQTRVTRAARALRAQPERNISDIALAVGFSSQAHFTLAFKRQLGTTPACWRNGAA